MKERRAAQQGKLLQNPGSKEHYAMKRPFEITVFCYEGHKGEQTPQSFIFGDNTIFVEEILDQWLAPDHRYFKLKAGSEVYIIRHDAQNSLWELVFYHTAP